MKRSIALLMLLLLLSGCSLPGLTGLQANTVKIGALTQTEALILAHMLEIMIERETDADVELVTHLGSSIVQHQGMLQGDLDITAARYTGTDLSGALGMDPITDPDEALAIVEREFDEQFDQTWGPTYGFENTYAVTITREFAEEHHIETVSDLEPFADDLRFGVDNAWINRKGDGYDGFQETYFSFGEVYPMSLGLVYEAVASGHMDVVLAYSTDGRIKEFDLKVLEDDRRFFPPYDASPVVSNGTLERFPEIVDIMERLYNQIDTEKMQELNYEADVLHVNPKTVAENFLKENNYFEDVKEGE